MKKLSLLLLLLIINLAWGAEAFVITNNSYLLSGSRANGVLGDYIIKNDSVSFVINNIPNTKSPGKSGGLCIDAVVNGGQDDFDLMYLYLNKTWPRQATYTSINIISAGTPNDSAHVQVSGVDSDNAQVSIVSDYILYDHTNLLKIISTFSNNSSSQLENYGMGDAFSWGNDINPFVPGLGSTREGSSNSTWLACTNTNSRYGYMAKTSFFAIHGGYWSDATIIEADIAPGESHTITRYFAVGNDLADIYLANTELNEIPTGKATITVTQNSLPVNNAQITFVKSIHEAPSFESRTNISGQSKVELETGSWTASCSYGDQVAEKTFSISSSSTKTIELRLGEVSIPVFPKDTLTVIQSPLVNIPSMNLPGETFELLLDLSSSISVNDIKIYLNDLEYDLNFSEASPENGLRKIVAILPTNMVYGLYDLYLTCSDTSKNDVSKNSIYIIPKYKKEFTVVHVTDTHLPSKYYWGDDGLEADSTEIEDFRAVIKDINIINPDFVIHTGDLVNDGEIEELGVPSISRAKKLMYELDVPLFLVAGNHDLGGWDATPAPDGTARRTWWNFFGWDYLNSTSATATTTQNYSFNYGKVHFIGLEAYDNYDEWRKELYGDNSFITSQLTWLNADLAAHSSDSLKVMFYHYDFNNEIDLDELGVDLAFWGHTHKNKEDDTHPFSISTAATCNGNRVYRIVKFKNNQFTNSLSVSAGGAGTELTILYNEDSSMVRINNNHNIDLEQCLVKFPLQTTETVDSLINAELFQIDTLSNQKMVYALVKVAANSMIDASIITKEIITALTPTIPETPFLMKAYPNPFNPKLAITYQVSVSSELEINVYDVQGRKIDTLYSGYQVPGSYKLAWDASAHPSGIYFIHAITNNNEGVKQVVEKCLFMK